MRIQLLLTKYSDLSDRGNSTTGETEDWQIALGLTADAVKRAERLARLMEKQPEWDHFRITPSAVMRVALLKGLDLLEAELRGGRRDQADPSGAMWAKPPKRPSPRQRVRSDTA